MIAFRSGLTADATSEMNSYDNVVELVEAIEKKTESARKTDPSK